MSRIQLKIAPYAKNWDNHKLIEKRQSTDTNTEMTQMLESSDKNFKVVIIKILQLAMIKTLKTNEK